jgi:hypothetical protein
VAGSPSKKAPRERYWGASVDGRRSGSIKPPPLTWRWWTRSSAPRTNPVVMAGGGRGATESVRSPSPASYAVDNAAARWRSRTGSPSGSSEQARSAGAGRGVETDRSWGRAVKHASLGVGSPQGGPASRCARALRGSGAWRSMRAQAFVTREPNDRGCTCRREVAEVGEEHLPRARQGSREANRASAG